MWFQVIIFGSWKEERSVFEIDQVRPGAADRQIEVSYAKMISVGALTPRGVQR
jgi:hypothetical protein